MPRIAMAHRIPYVATASVSNLRDLESKVKYAMSIRGARYIHIFVPCPLGWGSAPEDTIKIARLAVETGLFPLFEAQDGAVTASTPIRRRVPVTEYLKLQKRYAHLFRNPPDTGRIEQIQKMADQELNDDSTITVPNGPGLGVTIDKAALKEFSLAEIMLRADV